MSAGVSITPAVLSSGLTIREGGESVDSRRDLRVLITGSEMTPFAKTGGLADVIGSLPKALSVLGNMDVRTVIPKYRKINDAEHGLQDIPKGIYFHMGGRPRGIKLKCVEPDEGWKAYFIEYEEYFNRESLYGYHDDAQRFAFLVRAALEAAKAMDFRPDVVHCNDWHTGLLPVYLKTVYGQDPFFRDTATVFTIHNLAYRGVFSKEILPELDLGWEEFTHEKLEFWDSLSFIKGGLAYSDAINTVSKKYSDEIRTPDYGEGLEGLLNQRRDALFGIVNGLDYHVWDPKTDQKIARNYDISSIEGKVENKLALQRENYLPEDPQTPLIGIVSRLSYQKGLDIIAAAVHDIVAMGAQFVLLGTGDDDLVALFQHIGTEFPDRVGMNLIFSESMARRVYAGSDMFLMPSRYEPCGLGQLISMRYGTIPVVRRTGGLADTVHEYDPETGHGTGFCFDDGSPASLIMAIKRALDVYYHKDSWRRLTLNAMEADFSWASSARQYVELYQHAIENHSR
jgi:starch synthase